MTSNEQTELRELAELVYDCIKGVKDPEKDSTLEELSVISEELVEIERIHSDKILIKIFFTPTVPHCSLTTLIGLCLRAKLLETFPSAYKLDIFITPGTHDAEHEINKQINDKERVAAALENPQLNDLVQTCIADI